MSEESHDLFEIMSTTRSMRRLKPDPVPVALIGKILEAGVSAPSGGNMQRWRFIVVRDAKIKQTVGAYYKRAWDEVVAPRYGAGEPAPGTTPERFKRMLDAGPISGRPHPRGSALDRPVPRRSHSDPHGWLIDLSGRAEHGAGGTGTRSGRELDDALLEF
jgi:nitroreductase